MPAGSWSGPACLPDLHAETIDILPEVWPLVICGRASGCQVQGGLRRKQCTSRGQPPACSSNDGKLSFSSAAVSAATRVRVHSMQTDDKPKRWQALFHLCCCSSGHKYCHAQHASRQQATKTCPWTDTEVCLGMLVRHSCINTWHSWPALHEAAARKSCNAAGSRLDRCEAALLVPQVICSMQPFQPWLIRAYSL